MILHDFNCEGLRPACDSGLCREQAVRLRFAERLMMSLHVQVSDEAERSVLVKLKTECGYQFTSKLESMFTDIKTSRDTMQEYKARRQASANGEDDVELAVQVRIPWSMQPISSGSRLVAAGVLRQLCVLGCPEGSSSAVSCS